MFSQHLGEARGRAGGRKALLRVLFLLLSLSRETPVVLWESFPAGERNVTNFLLENGEGMVWKTAALILDLSGGNAPSHEHGNMEVNFRWICSGSLHP